MVLVEERVYIVRESAKAAKILISNLSPNSEVLLVPFEPKRVLISARSGVKVSCGYTIAMVLIILVAVGLVVARLHRIGVRFFRIKVEPVFIILEDEELHI